MPENEPDYAEWTLRGLFGGICNLTDTAEREINAALKLGQKEKASRIAAKWRERIDALAAMIEERLTDGK